MIFIIIIIIVCKTTGCKILLHCAQTKTIPKQINKKMNDITPISLNSNHNFNTIT